MLPPPSDNIALEVLCIPISLDCAKGYVNTSECIPAMMMMGYVPKTFHVFKVVVLGSNLLLINNSFYSCVPLNT